MDKVERIRLVLKDSGDTQVEMAKKLGITQPYISKLFKNDDVNPSNNLLRAIASTYNTNLSWLIEGTGPMYKDEESDAMAIIDAAMTSNNEFMKKMLVKFAKLDVKYWEMLKEIVDQLKD